jgi:hypothetical protein
VSFSSFPLRTAFDDEMDAGVHPPAQDAFQAAQQVGWSPSCIASAAGRVVPVIHCSRCFHRAGATSPHPHTLSRNPPTRNRQAAQQVVPPKQPQSPSPSSIASHDSQLSSPSNSHNTICFITQPR